ncbi:prolipoprotein diacylglyceryl transferase [compost metagenome]
MPEMLRIGPINLQTGLLALLLGYVLGAGLIHLHLRRLAGSNKMISDVWLTCGMIILLFWKFGVILTSPSILFKDPMKILFLTGGTLEVLLGICAAGFYAYGQLRKHRIPIYTALDVAAIGMITVVLVYVSMIPSFGQQTDLPWGIGVEGTQTQFHPVNAYMAIALVPLWIRLITSRRDAGSGKVFKEILIYVGFAGLLISLLDRVDPIWLYVSYSQLCFLVMIAAGMLLPSLSPSQQGLNDQLE